MALLMVKTILLQQNIIFVYTVGLLFTVGSGIKNYVSLFLFIHLLFEIRVKDLVDK